MRDLKKIPVEQIKEDILGKRYELSIVFISKADIKSLNKKYRNKNEPTDILSFDLSLPNSSTKINRAGEIFICPEIAKIKSKKFGTTYQNYLLLLVIHGMLHLKGLEHSDKMEQYELTYHSRYRRRNL